MKTPGTDPARTSADPGGRLVLDTSAYSHFRAGHPAVLDRLARATAIVVPVTVLGELEAAFELGTRARANRQSLADFLNEAFVTVWPTSASVARQYGRLFARLKTAGTPIPTNDVWIASTTLDCAGRLLTFDTHYRHVAGLDADILTP